MQYNSSRFAFYRFFSSLEAWSEWYFLEASILRNYILGIYKVLLLLSEYGDPSYLFQNLASLKMNEQQ